MLAFFHVTLNRHRPKLFCFLDWQFYSHTQNQHIVTKITEVYRGIQRYTEVFRGIQRYTEVYRGIQRYTEVCRCIQRYTVFLSNMSNIFVSNIWCVIHYEFTVCATNNQTQMFQITSCICLFVVTFRPWQIPPPRSPLTLRAGVGGVW